MADQTVRERSHRSDILSLFIRFLVLLYKIDRGQEGKIERRFVRIAHFSFDCYHRSLLVSNSSYSSL